MPDGIVTAFSADVTEAALRGLTATPKTLPSKLFYDAAGCALFERITGLPEYYVTRTEMALLPGVAAEVADLVPPQVTLVEYGAGSAAKATIMLAALRAPYRYIPIDVAGPTIAEAAKQLRDGFPAVNVTPVQADFMAPLVLPPGGGPVMGFFPGSTIGNLEPSVAVSFLREARVTLGVGALFLIGADLRKESRVLIPAYDDAAGVTAAFNRNLLTRLNREAGADFPVDRFTHRAVWNTDESRIEMHLVSLDERQVRVGGRSIGFAAGETIHTENSYKHSRERMVALAAEAGWGVRGFWTDAGQLFGLHLFEAG